MVRGLDTTVRKLRRKVFEEVADLVSAPMRKTLQRHSMTK